MSAIGTQLLDLINSGLTRWRMAVSNILMDAAAESERNPVNKHQPIRFILSVENERADTRRDGRSRLARSNSQARTGSRKNDFPCSSDHEQGWQTYRSVHTLLKVLNCVALVQRHGRPSG